MSDTNALPSTGELLEIGLDVLHGHQRHAQATIRLIASESLMAPIARLPLLCDVYGRYMFDDGPDPASGEWRFPSARSAAWLETGLAVPLLRHLTGAPYVNVRPLSGLHAMQMVLAALADPGHTIVSVAAAQGGHYATSGLARRLGHRVVHLRGSDPAHLDELTELCRADRPALVYLDQCHVLEPFDIAAIASVVKEASPATVVHVDVSHVLGLVLGGALPNPLREGADSLSASTHKTFPGPHKGIIATRDPLVDARIRAVQPQFVSSHHFGAVAALGLALACFADRAPAYASTVVAAARALGKELSHAGWEVAGADIGHTRTHQLWATVPDIAAHAAAERLYEAGIYVNWLTDLPLPTPALRLGLAEAIWTGLAPEDMPQLAAIMDCAVSGSRPPAELRAAARVLKHSAAPYPFVSIPKRAAASAATLADALYQEYSQ